MPRAQSVARRWLGLGALATLAGCFDDSRSSTVDFATLPLWVVDSVPSITIGAPLGDETQELDYVRAATFLSDGAIVIADQGRFALRYYAPDGQFTRSFGRRGDGPGEFRTLVDLTCTRDTLVAYDAQHQRFTWVSREGHFIGSAQSPFGQRVHFPVVLARGDSVWFLMGPRAPRGFGLVRDTVDLVVLTRTGVFRTLLTRPGEEHWAEPHPRGGITWQTDFTHRRLLAAGGGTSIYLALTDSPIIRRYGLDGSLLGEARWDTRMRPFDRAARDEYLSHFRNYAPAAQRDLKRRLSQRQEPPTLPVLSRLLVDGRGNIWARPHTMHPTTPAEWMVFDSTLVPIARARMQPGVLHIGTAQTLVRWRDEDDVDYVRLQSIRVQQSSSGQ